MNMLLSNFLLLLNLTYFSSSFLKKTSLSRIVFSLFFIMGVLLLSTINYPNNQLIGTAIMTSFYIFFIFIFYKGKLYKKLLTLLLFILTISFSELFIANSMNYLFNLTETKLNTLIYTFAIILSNLVAFILLFLLVRFIKIDILAKHTKFMWFSLFLPITTLLFLYNFSNYFDTFKDNITILIVVFGLIISNIISLVAISNDLKNMELRNEVENSKIKYEILNNQYNANFYFLHDTIRELTKLSSLMDENNYLEFQKDVVNLNHNLSRSFNTTNSNSELINSLMNYRITDINKYNIDVKTVMDYKDFSFLSQEDKQFLFSNLLNLSINSCINSQEKNPRFIFKTMKLKQQIIIQCSFTCNDLLLLNLASIDKVISKYNGHISKSTYKNIDLIYFDLMIVFFTTMNN